MDKDDIIMFCDFAIKGLIGVLLVIIVIKLKPENLQKNPSPSIRRFTSCFIDCASSSPSLSLPPLLFDLLFPLVFPNLSHFYTKRFSTLSIERPSTAGTHHRRFVLNHTFLAHHRFFNKEVLREIGANCPYQWIDGKYIVHKNERINFPITCKWDNGPLDLTRVMLQHIANLCYACGKQGCQGQAHSQSSCPYKATVSWLVGTNCKMGFHLSKDCLATIMEK